LRFLLDANVPRRLKHHLSGHEVSTARDMGWNALPDGGLLECMAGDFDVRVTMDKSLPFQQRLGSRPFAVIVLGAPSNRIGDLLPLVPEVLVVLESASPGELHVVGSVA
jgi:hypothetical protein